MTRQDFTDITLIVDRSGSMIHVLSDAEGGVNSFVKEQAVLSGDAVLTLVEFDDRYEFLHKAVPIAAVPPYTLVPRGWTALLDAVGRAIVETGDRLKAMKEEDRPGLVVFVIVTDGHENSSKEFSYDKIKEMITRQRQEYKWQFTFLGADEQAFDEGAKMGITKHAIASYTEENTSGAFKVASSNVARMRSSSAAGQSVQNIYTDTEREALQ